MTNWRKVKQAPNGELYTSESASQTSCVRWFRTVYPKLWRHIFSIPNGAKIGGHVTKRGFPVMAAILKGEGMTEGVADLMLALPRSGFHGLFIEMKTPVGSLSADQREFLESMSSEEYAVAVFKSQSEFERDVVAYLEGRFVQSPVWMKKRDLKKSTKKTGEVLPG